jgi:hypothetical protein
VRFPSLLSDDDNLVECDNDQDLDDTEEQVEDDKGGKGKKRGGALPLQVPETLATYVIHDKSYRVPILIWHEIQ